MPVQCRTALATDESVDVPVRGRVGVTLATTSMTVVIVAVWSLIATLTVILVAAAEVLLLAGAAATRVIDPVSTRARRPPRGGR